MIKAGKRLTILSNFEIENLYGIPFFNDEQRANYFRLDDLENVTMKSLKSLESRVYFILQLGYFKYKRIFCKINFEEIKKDVEYILSQYFSGSKLKKMVSKKTRIYNHSKILSHISYVDFDKESEKKLIERAFKFSKTCVDPKRIFDDLLDYLDQIRTSIPGYSTLQKIISKVLMEENERLQSIVTNHIPQYVDKALQRLLKNDEQMYGVTLLKKDAKGFNYTEIMHEIDKKCSSDKLYTFAKKIIPKLEISSQNVCYYASLVDYYTVDKLNEL